MKSSSLSCLVLGKIVEYMEVTIIRLCYIQCRFTNIAGEITLFNVQKYLI